jgi:hypothetical protein
MANEIQNYKAEQQRLKSEYEGKPKEDIRITAPQEPEVNPEVWKDVEPMLFRGFLTVAAEINGVYFVFKSLNHHEFEFLRFSGILRDQQVKTQFWDTFLSYEVFMIDGINILPDRERWVQRIAEMFSEFPKEAKSKIIRHVSEVNRRSSAAVILAEAYAMESISRYRWMQLKGLDLTTTAVTGIVGTQQLGLNWAQQLWRALNLAEDRNEQHERDWENAKFIGSCFAGKGLNRVYSQDSDRRQKEKEERIARKDKLLREVLLGEKIPEKSAQLPGAVITMPRTVEELANQLEKDLRGEQDWHDKVVEQHEKRIREQYQARQRQQEEAAKGNAARFGNYDVIGGSEVQGLTPQEVEERIRHSKQIRAQNAARMQVVPFDEKTEMFLDKWGVTGPEISTEISTTDKDPSGASALPVRKASIVTPFRKK